MFPQGFGDRKPKSSTSAQEVKTLDGIYIDQVRGGGRKEGSSGLGRLCSVPGRATTLGSLCQVAMGYAHSLAVARDESEADTEKLKKLPEYNPRTL